MPGSEAPFPWGPAEERLGAKINARVPHSARVWGYWLGGKDYYPADQQAGDECLAIFPALADTVMALRYFTARAPGEVQDLLDGMELITPGPVPVSRWRPEHSLFDHPDVPAWGGIWRKP